ncbi:hypothetical protein EV193_104544 [Herbihabitans rhizosphaerae]|uniref:Uncharacterized protein n=1 Tax=Herbihabitans rhizosphaerae TaxID=1872711 RepID=A0A4Q7KS45_9PSEU|nr:hypothetical protein [Herbihabitans rhizosphaerae]RZS39327.1 hypothetical protein EV193_104544 [Herbihabitans rhizosphaerae]
MAFITERVAGDFANSGLGTFGLHIDRAFSGDTPLNRDHTSARDVVCVSGGHVFTIGLEYGVEFACAEVAFRLQDDAIDARWRPWPELHTADGRFVGVLAPKRELNTVAQWYLGDTPFCAVGHLLKACEAAGLRIAE